ncbi:MAG TPA: prolipoprotein diacylglyceryl transferase family protein [Polyangiaceae bacterium]|nr:prolipoprotein diacylglyceryl transferase family protein [Polyangiaceae bacterium]
MIAYSLCAIIGVLFSAWAWDRWRDQANAQRKPPPPMTVLLGALLGMALGAKLGFIFAEWPTLVQMTGSQAAQAVIAGKTVTGALIGGYFAVRWTRRRIGFHVPTGDAFALIVPVSMIIGRVGCLNAGCCLGVPMREHWFTLTDGAGVARWPAVPIETAFNLLFLLWAWIWGRRTRSLSGQMFHMYLISYGAFRFWHESLRDTPRWWGSISGYQLLALAMIALGIWQYRERKAAAPLNDGAGGSVIANG